MYRNIYVGYDGANASQDAAALAAMLGSGGFTLVNVYPGGHGDGPGDEPAYQNALLEHADATLKAGRERWATRGDVKTRSVAAPSAARGLHEAAESGDADLIVIGSTHHGPVGRVVPGSTGGRLLHGALAPVGMAPRGFAEHGEDPELRVIGVAYDGSEEADAALDAAVRLARESGAALRLLGVAQPLTLYPVPGYGPTPTSWDDGSRYMEERLAKALERVPSDVEAAGEVLEAGDPAVLIADEAEDRIDLLFAGSRGYGPVKSVLVGAVSGRIAQKSPCPVIVVPRFPEVPAAEKTVATGAES